MNALALMRRSALAVTDDFLSMEALRERRAEILRLARTRAARRIAVFGSLARGEAQHGSGVDVVSRSGLKPRDNHIRGEAIDL